MLNKIYVTAPQMHFIVCSVVTADRNLSWVGRVLFHLDSCFSKLNPSLLLDSFECFDTRINTVNILSLLSSNINFCDIINEG